MKLKISIFITLVLLLTSCSPSISIPPITDPNSLQLPDLVVSYINVSMVDVNGKCLNGFQIQVTIWNQGTAIANNITAIETATGQTFSIDMLGVGEKFTVTMPASSSNGIYMVNIDPQNTIPELNETNNNLSFLSPTPTPVISCAILTPTFTQVSVLDLPTYPSLSLTLTAAPTFPSVPSLSENILLNATYYSGDWGTSKLTDGVFYRTSSPGTPVSETYTTRFQGPFIFGDLNYDGAEDALVILSTQNGGTGHFIELAAMVNENGFPINVNTFYLGDRVVVDSGYIQDGLITLNLRAHAPSDGLCCPSLSVTWLFRLIENMLIQQP